MKRYLFLSLVLCLVLTASAQPVPSAAGSDDGSLPETITAHFAGHAAGPCAAVTQWEWVETAYGLEPVPADPGVEGQGSLILAGRFLEAHESDSHPSEYSALPKDVRVRGSLNVTWEEDGVRHSLHLWLKDIPSDDVETVYPQSDSFTLLEYLALGWHFEGTEKEAFQAIWVAIMSPELSAMGLLQFEGPRPPDADLVDPDFWTGIYTMIWAKGGGTFAFGGGGCEIEIPLATSMAPKLSPDHYNRNRPCT